MNLKKQKEVLKAAHFSYQIWVKQKEKSRSGEYKFLKTYSIGDFMEFKPLEHHLKSDKLGPEEVMLKHF